MSGHAFLSAFFSQQMSGHTFLAAFSSSPSPQLRLLNAMPIFDVHFDEAIDIFLRAFLPLWAVRVNFAVLILLILIGTFIASLILIIYALSKVPPCSPLHNSLPK